MHLIGSGEKTGQLPELLDRGARNLSRDLERRAMAMTALLEPALILVMGGFVLLIVLAVMMPILEMNQLIRQTPPHGRHGAPPGCPPRHPDKPANKGRATRWAARPEPDDRNASERFVGFAGADADGLLDRGDEDLAVADLAGARGLDHGLDGLLDAVVGSTTRRGSWQEIDHVLGAAVKLGMALLAAEALNLGDGQAADADSRPASRTSSSLKGLMMAVTCFTLLVLVFDLRGRPGAAGRSRRLFADGFAESVGDRITPIPAERARRDARSGRCLAALVLIDADEAHDLLHRPGG